jgi:3-oxoadipate enol-lactonase
MPYIVTKGVRSYYDVFGEGPPMLMLHCNPFDHWVFVYQIAHFSTWFRVVTPDLRGYGRTDKVTTPYSVSDLCDDVVGLIEKEKLQGCILLGVSIGSVISIRLAHDRPDLFKAVIVAGAASPPKDRGPNDPVVKAYRETDFAVSYRNHMNNTVSKGYAESPFGRWMIDTFHERRGRMEPEGIVKLLQARAPENLLPLLPNIKLPMLVINGEHDNALKGGQQTASLVPGAIHKTLPNTGHACCMEDPAGFDTFVLDFLKDRGLMPPLKK